MNPNADLLDLHEAVFRSVTCRKLLVLILLVEVIEQHDVAAVVVELRIKNIAAVCGDRQSREGAATANLEYRAYFPGGEVEVIEHQDIVHRKEINTAWDNVPVRHEG